MLARLRPYRVALLAVFDGIAWLASLALFAVVRLDSTTRPVAWSAIIALGIVAGSLQFIFGGAVRLHHGRAGLGSFDEIMMLGVVTGIVGACLSLVNVLALADPVPRSIPLAATFMALAIAAWCRAALQRLRERRGGWRDYVASEPVLILGAGEGGYQLLRSMVHDRARQWRPVGLLDDDLLKRHRRLFGVPVLGTLNDLGAVARNTGSHSLIIAIPSASNELIKNVRRRAADCGLTLKVVPGISDLPDGRVRVGDVRDLDVTDLLGRHQVDTDVDSIGHYLQGKRVLVTGAGGSIGSELCRQIHTFNPAELIMLDRDESALHAVQLSIYGVANLDAPNVVLADIRDRVRVIEIFEGRRPEVVFHAAALKHLTMLEQFPAEAIKTNVWGTDVVLQAAQTVHVERFVNISTDKAANPCSVLGYTKRLAEGLTSSVARNAAGSFLSVRFGNVLGSRGSVLTTFTAQIDAGGPVTVTDPQVTRYFMTIQEAVQLVIQAAVIGRGGEVLVLDMGAPVRIADVAKQMVEWSERPIEITYTGLHAGEKLHEELFGSGEPDVRPVHPLISHAHVPPVSLAELRLDVTDRHALLAELARSCAAMSTATLVDPGLTG